MPSHEDLTAWKAAGWDELVQVWRDLVGDPMTSIQHTSAFQGEEISSEDAGYVFQTWVIEAFQLSDAEIEPPFRIPVNPDFDDRTRHEVDGLLVCGWNGFLIESKFQYVDFIPIARLHLLAEGCPIGTMGLLFAAKGFTSTSLDAAHLLSPMRVLLFDHKDIEAVLAEDEPNLIEAVRKKWKAAIMFGRANFSLANLRNQGADK